MEPTAVDDGELDRLMRLSDLGDPPPWSAWVEGRDQAAGDAFIVIGADADRREDLYLTRDSGPADPATHDLVAAARNALLILIEEIRRRRSQLDSM